MPQAKTPLPEKKPQKDNNETVSQEDSSLSEAGGDDRNSQIDDVDNNDGDLGDTDELEDDDSTVSVDNKVKDLKGKQKRLVFSSLPFAFF